MVNGKMYGITPFYKEHTIAALFLIQVYL